MTKIPVISGREAIKALGKLGYARVRQTGSHVRLKSNAPGRRPVTVPLHREVKPKTLKSILGQAGVTLEEFRKLL